MIKEVASKITDEVDFFKKHEVISYLNVYNYSILRRHPEVMNNIDHYTLDGILLILFLRITMNKKIKRKAPDFSSYFIELFDFFQKNNTSVAFYGGTEDEISKFLKTVKGSYPKLNIVKSFNGYDYNEEEVCKSLLKNDIDVIVAGLGTPKQEIFLTNLKSKGFSGTCFSCGAFISQTAKTGMVYFSENIDRLHLRWLYRIYKEPKMFKRYFLEYPKALYYLTLDRFFKSPITKN